MTVPPLVKSAAGCMNYTSLGEGTPSPGLGHCPRQLHTLAVDQADLENESSNV